jgi:hypothetical protein
MIYNSSLAIGPSGWLLLFTEVKKKVRTQELHLLLIPGLIKCIVSLILHFQ